jgi:hypothetical protein
MRRLLIALLFFASLVSIRSAWYQDNLLAVDIDNKQQVLAQENKTAQDENVDKAEAPVEEVMPPDDSEGDLKEIKAYREVLENKQKELEVIKLDLEKSNLILKKRQTEKEIYEINKALPQGEPEASSLPGSVIQGAKDSLVDASDIKIQLLLIADNLKKGQISLKGAPYSFKEGDCIASKLTAEEIKPSGITFKQHDGSLFKLNFVN